MGTPHWLWEEIQQFWSARSFTQKMKTSAPSAENTQDLISLAKQQGFDVDPSWEDTESADSE